MDGERKVLCQHSDSDDANSKQSINQSIYVFWKKSWAVQNIQNYT